MASTIPSLDYPAGMTPPTPSAGGSSTGLPAIPALPSIDKMLNVDTSQGALTGLAAAANGTTVAQQTANQNNSVVGQTTAATNSIFSQFGAWLKSIAVPGTFVVVALLLIVLSVYIAVTQHGGVVLPK